MKRIQCISAAALILSVPNLAIADEDDWYVSFSGGAAFQEDSDNSGVTEAFTTGNIGDGTTIDIPAGALSTFTTDFNVGFSLSAEIGRRLPAGFRTGIELAYTDSDVNEHDNLEIDGVSLEPFDVAALTGDTGLFNTTVNEVLNAGNGDIEQFAGFWNLYYDLNFGRLQPYVGGGVGVARVGVTYNPSLFMILNDNRAAFAYQGRAGLAWKLSKRFDAFTDYTFRGTPDLDFQNELIPADLDVENQQHIWSFGLRYNFGSAPPPPPPPPPP
ncbi:MAG: P44/Msp2 family outer membrane protein, partial [Pseudomonadota bacterium]